MADQTAVIFGRVPPGTRLNDTYEIDTLIAAGGMGEVYRGHLIETSDQVAIKLIRPELIGNEAALALFRKEASALHHLHHEAIIRYFVFAIDPVLKRPYLAMEFVDGEPLSDLIKRGPLAVGQCAILLRRLAAGLAAAHEIGIIHRDISADNVILPGGDVRRAKIIDFGIAKSTLFGATTVIGDGFAGKYNYVSPEQLGLFGGTITAKSDIYSLGLLIAEALRGKPLDMGRSHVETIERRREVPDLAGVDAALAPLLSDMLQPQPDDRPASMEAIRDWSARPLPSAAAEAAPMAEFGARRRGRLRAAEAELHAPPRRRWVPVAVGAAALFAVAATSLAVITWAPGLIPGQTTGAADDDPFPPLTPANRPPAERRDGQSPPLLTQSPGQEPRDGAAPASPADQNDQAPTSLAEALERLRRQSQGREQGAQGQTPATVEPVRTEPGAPSPEPVRTDPPPRPGPSRPEPEGAPSPVVLGPATPAVTPVTPPPSPTLPLPTLPTPRLPEPATPADFVRSYDGGPCLFLAVRSAGDRQVDVEGFGVSKAAIDRFDVDFKRANGFEAQIQFRPLSQAQCPAVDFLRMVAGERDPALRFDLQTFNVRPGRTIDGTIQGAGLKSVSVLMVTDDGLVQHVPARSQPSGRVSLISIATEPGTVARQRPKLVLAIVAAQRPAALDFRGQASAATLFPALQRELAGNPQSVSVLRQYFRIEN
ncbi:serine/threonine-protein kinase [Phreatobacter stygius]|uniref:Serine/threonine protein kinase n=1 Tax=Phreatobacter stygius TaxID=1940610 RepID=A0A4D7AZ37_9HYPH|nr:protein kinase [Phreatobacter stygius]QCI64053.1 serine/threonine protein kinase [Phreatobacter stygius]